MVDERSSADEPAGENPAGESPGESPGDPASSRPATGTRLLLSLLVFQVVVQVPPLLGQLFGGTSGATTAGDEGLDDLTWIRFGLAAALLALLIVVARGFAARPGEMRLLGRIALAAAIVAQGVLVIGWIAAIARYASSTPDAPTNPPGGSSDFILLHAVIAIVVFLLTLVAYATVRPAGSATTADPPPPAASRNRSRLGRTALGLAAILIVVTGSVASASRPSSPITCVDVTRDVGIAFRGALGNAVVDGSDTSVEMQQNMGNGVAVGDYDGDGDIDLYLLGQAGHPNRAYRNDHGPSGDGFTEVTDAAGLGGLSGSRAAQFVDLDNDGTLDLVVANDYATSGLTPGATLQPSRIYRGLGDGTFRDVTAASGFDPVGVIVGGMGIADYDRDGLLDIYVTYWTGGMELGATYDARNILFRNTGDLHFEDVTEAAGLGTMSTGSFTPVFADLNGDRWPDLYVAVDGAPEALYLNDHGAFHDATKASGLGTIRNGMGAALVYLDGGSLPSLYVTNITEPEYLVGTPPGGNALLRPTAGQAGAITYADDAAATGIRDGGWGWGAIFADMDRDGYQDMYAVQGMDVATRGVSTALTNDRAHLFRGGADGVFERSTSNGCDIPGDQRAVVALDYDRDGDADLLVSQVAYDFTLLENRSESAGHWLTVIVDPSAGRPVVGATITVTAGDRRWVQTLIGGGSYLAGPPNEAYFGLGPADRVTVTVAWPDDTTTVRADVPANQALRIQQP